jgi:hypothetical protein
LFSEHQQSIQELLVTKTLPLSTNVNRVQLIPLQLLQRGQEQVYSKGYAVFVITIRMEISLMLVKQYGQKQDLKQRLLPEASLFLLRLY